MTSQALLAEAVEYTDYISADAPPISVLYVTQNDLMVSIQSWSFGKYLPIMKQIAKFYIYY